MDAKPSILFVCRANICRSPMAEGIARQWLKERNLHRKWVVDSAGTHAGGREKTDARAQRVCIEKGVNLKRLRSRPITEKDFEKFDMILAMDAEVLEDLRKAAPDGALEKLAMLSNEAVDEGKPGVPDPYFGSVQGFYRVYDILQGSVTRLLQAHE
ncbi:low molecular weight phosphotyrosine protein phosphatase [Pseudomaricurvus alkylphenolicus]|nr:low molecular weight phosphotyrosine protein phosphatase [Pseudomaricurvus alkylphenolicus]